MTENFGTKNTEFTFLSDLHSTQLFTDVTIVCDDHKECLAHKAVLSLSSPFFKQILNESENKDTILYLKGTSSTIFEYIKSFIYLGIVNIPIQDAEYFFMAAKDLQIRGLISNNMELNFSTNEEIIMEEEKKDTNCYDMTYEMLESFEKKPEAGKLEHVTDSPKSETENIPQFIQNSDTPNKSDQKIQKCRKRKSFPNRIQFHKKVKCDSCDYVATQSGNLKVHKISKHEGKLFQCDQCTSTFKHLSSVHDHVRRKHENVNFPCEYCEYKASSAYILREHIKWKHLGILQQCDECGFEVGTKNGLIEHKNFRHKEKTLKCYDGCTFTASTPAGLKQHQKSKLHNKHIPQKEAGDIPH